MIDKLKKYYYSSPPAMANIMYLLPLEFRLGGRDFIETLKFIGESERWNHEKLRALQAHRLNKILSFAVKNVPFYKDIKLEGDAFKNVERFPIISKDDILENSNHFMSKSIKPGSAYIESTGGSSGKQFQFHVDNSLYGIEWGFIISLWKRVGYELGDKVVSIKGGSVRFKKYLWREQPIYNGLEMSACHMNSLTLPRYLEQIRKRKPKFIHGYPSAITILAKYVLDNGMRDLPHVKAALLSSENIYSSQRELIEEAFNTRAFSWYGQSEKMVLAGECEISRKYHVFPQYGFMELIGPDGSVIRESGEEGEIVGTGFFNFAMPFIRYKTEDRAVLSEEQKCRCGRNYLLIEEVRGRRLQEMVVGKHKSLISLSALNFHGKELNKLNRLQFYQERVGEVILRLKPRPGFTKEDEKNVIEIFKNKVGDELNILVDYDSDIELTLMGKAKDLVQKLDLSEWWKLRGN